MKIIKQEVQAIADLKAGYTLGHADVAILNELARIALASLEAEASWRNPVLAYADSYRDMANQGVESIPVWSVITDLERNIAPLFTAPPAPVSVPTFEEWCELTKRNPVGWVRDAMKEAYDGCRDAMLQGAVQPQNQQQNIPENIPVTQFKPVADLYGLTSPTGSETSFTFDAIEARDFFHGGWSVQEYVELERYQQACVGNSPAIPDGWVLVPVDMAPEMMRAVQINSELGAYAAANLTGAYSLFREFWDVAVTAAPQQEA